MTEIRKEVIGMCENDWKKWKKNIEDFQKYYNGGTGRLILKISR